MKRIFYRLTLALIGISLGLAASADDKVDALKSLEGKWKLHEAVLAARDHKDDFQGMKLTIAGTKFTLDFGPNSDKGELTIDATKKPKEIDLKCSEMGPFKGRTLPGIYEIKDNLLIVCCDSAGKTRPTAFEAPEKTTTMLLTYQREKK